jgi:multidrug transporter EmrE-like cation transporter
MYLFIASGFEILFAFGLKCTEGFTRLVPSALTAAVAFAVYQGKDPSNDHATTES